MVIQLGVAVGVVESGLYQQKIYVNTVVNVRRKKMEIKCTIERCVKCELIRKLELRLIKFQLEHKLEVVNLMSNGLIYPPEYAFTKNKSILRNRDGSIRRCSHCGKSACRIFALDPYCNICYLKIKGL